MNSGSLKLVLTSSHTASYLGSNPFFSTFLSAIIEFTMRRSSIPCFLGIKAVGLGVLISSVILATQPFPINIAHAITCGAAGFTDIGGGVCRGFITTTGSGSFTIPGDWTDTNKIEVIGGGGGESSNLAYPSAGGGGGAYAYVEDVIGLSGSISYSVGVGGGTGGAGGDTWFGAGTCGGADVCAGGGQAGADWTGGSGGTVQAGSGYSGGDGGDTAYPPAINDGGGGGGGAGGPHKAGGSGGVGASDGGGGGGGGDGSNGSNASGDAGGTGGDGPSGSGGGTVPGGNGTADTGGGGGGASDDLGENGGNGATGDGTGSGTEWGAGKGSGGGGGGGADDGEGGSGGLYGGGAGGYAEDGVSQATAAQGILVITYTAGSGNTLPVTSNVSIDSGAVSITLTEATTANVVCTATVTDNDGYADIDSVEAKLYRTAVGAGAGDDNSNHYTVSGDANCVPSDGAGTTETYTCTIPVEFYADPTDAGSAYEGDNWTCQITPTDSVGDGTPDTDTIEMDTLTALDVTSSIAYGALALGGDTGTSDQTTTVTNTGNELIDIQLDGYGAGDGDGYAMTCTIGNIVIGNERYDTSASTAWSAKTQLTDSAVSLISFNLAKGAASTKAVYWGFGMPSTGVGGSCTGTVNFTAVSG